MPTPTQLLADFCARYPTRRDAAQALGISPAYLSDLVHGKRSVTARVLAKIGYQARTTYVRVEEDQ